MVHLYDLLLLLLLLHSFTSIPISHIYFSYFSYFYLILHKNLLNLNTRNFPCCVNIVMQWNVYLPLEATAIFLMKIFNYITVSRKFSINIFHVSSKDYCNDLYIYILYYFNSRNLENYPSPPTHRIETYRVETKERYQCRVQAEGKEVLFSKRNQ